MRLFLLLPLLLGFSVPAIAHNEANGGDAMHSDSELTPLPITPFKPMPIGPDGPCTVIGEPGVPCE